MNDDGTNDGVEIQGELTRRLAWAPVRALMVVSGLALVRGLVVLAARYCLALRRGAVARLSGASLTVDAEWTFLGRRIRSSRTTAPVTGLRAVRLENRQRYLHLVVGLGQRRVDVHAARDHTMARG